MKSVIFGIALLSGIGLATTAQAGDGGLKDSRDDASAVWTGYYIGGFAGGAWGDASVSTNIGSVTGTSYIQTDSNADAIENSGLGSIDDTVFTGGILVGGTMQSGRWVYGAELDFGSFNLEGSQGKANQPYPDTPPATFAVRTTVETNWLMTARARLGWLASDSLLLYATGGLALTNLDVTNSFSDDADSLGIGGGSQSDTKAGWVIGGGVELALPGNWTLRGEYLHVDFGSVTAKSSIGCTQGAPFDCSALSFVPSSSLSTSADLSADIARAALALRF